MGLNKGHFMRNGMGLPCWLCKGATHLESRIILHHMRLINNVLSSVLCLVASFFIVLFPLGDVVDYLSQVSNDFLNRTGLGFADGEIDPSFLWVLLALMLIVTAVLMLLIRTIHRSNTHKVEK